MTARALRASVPILLLLAGGASIFAGVRLHGAAVLAQVEKKEPAGATQERPAWLRHGSAEVATKQYVATWMQESEPQLIKEVTVGGVTLAQGRAIHRTYNGLDIPLLCPT